MAVAFDGEAVVSSGFSGASSVTLTGKTTAGSNRVAIIHVGWSGTSTTCTCTYGGVAATVVLTANSGSGVLSAMFYFINPPTGATNVVVTWGVGDATGFAGVSSYNGADQTTPLRGSTSTTGTSSPVTATIGSAVDDIVVDAVGEYNDTLSVGAGQTSLFMSNSGAIYGAGSREDGAASVVMSWTGSTVIWATVVASIQPVSGGGGGGGGGNTSDCASSYYNQLTQAKF